jgi:CubicO group peptidase (beta-lactamase class C family)
VNNFEVKKRPCSRALGLFGFVYFFVLIILLLMRSCYGSGADERVAQFEKGLHAQPEMDVSQMFQYGAARLDLTERMKHYGVPGLSVTVIDDTAIDWYRTWGVRDAVSGALVTPGTRFEAASASKLVTAVMVMKLVEQGVLDLDAPVNGYLERWQIPDNELTRGRAVSLRQLLSHSSGMNRPDSMYFFTEGSSPTLLDVLNGALPAINDAALIEYPPGRQHRYSNLAYNVIQLLMEEVTGLPFQQVMQEGIFDPLGMSTCSYRFPFSAAELAVTAFPHDDQGKPRMNDLHPAALAHGGLLCSSQDLARLTVALMESIQGEGGGLLAMETAAGMLEEQHVVEENVGGFNGQGLGMFLLTDGQTTWFAHHGYNTPGTGSLIFANPQSGDGVVIMANGADAFSLVFEILAGLADLYDWPEVKTDPQTPVSSGSSP